MSHMLLPREQQLADGSYLTRIYKSQKDQRAKRNHLGYRSEISFGEVLFHS